MSIFCISMKKSDEARNVDTLYELAFNYLDALAKNGQLLGNEWMQGFKNDILNYYVATPRHDSLDMKYNNGYVNNALERLTMHLGARPTYTLMNDQEPRRYPRLKTANFLYLHSTPHKISSPILRGNDGNPIPTYLLPIDQDDRERLTFWMRQNNRFIQIFEFSGALEIPAYRQISDPNSIHAREGRNLCKIIEKATNIKTYFYLERHWGRKHGEENRPCPLCGKEWKITNQRNKSAFWNFDFKCDICGIVSHRSNINDNEKYARIGEFKKNIIS